MNGWTEHENWRARTPGAEQVICHKVLLIEMVVGERRPWTEDEYVGAMRRTYSGRGIDCPVEVCRAFVNYVIPGDYFQPKRPPLEFPIPPGARKPKQMLIDEKGVKGHIAGYMAAKMASQGIDRNEAIRQFRSKSLSADGEGISMQMLFEQLGRMNVTKEEARPWTEWTRERSGYERERMDATARAIPVEVRRAIDRGQVDGVQARRLIKDWMRMTGPRSFGCLLHGKAGAGKTLHACLMLRGHVFRPEPQGIYITESGLIELLKGRASADKRGEIAKVRSCPLLVLDDMGQSRLDSAARADVIGELKKRWEAGRKCAIAFRGTVQEFQEAYGLSAWATIERFCAVVKVTRT